MSPIKSFYYIFRKYPLVRTITWVVLIVIAIVSTTVINLKLSHDPLLESISPSIGSPGDIIVLRGDYFGSTRNAAYVEIGGERLTASSYLSWTNNEIRIILPSNIHEGLVFIDVSGKRSMPKVFTNEATIPVGVPVNPQIKVPIIASFSANSIATGQLLVITGANFGDIRNESKVLFKTSREGKSSSEVGMLESKYSDMISANADEFDYELWSDSEIRVRVPDGAITGNVIVETEKGASRPQVITVNNRGTKTFSNGRSYSIQISADISNLKATSTSSLSLHVPRPVVMASQPDVRMTECRPAPLLENYRNTIIHQVEFEDFKENKQVFTQNFMIQVFEISTNINPTQVKAFTETSRQLYTDNIKADAYIPADNESVVELVTTIIGKEKNPYNQAKLIYNYLLDNFMLLQSSNIGDFNILEVLDLKQCDSYDFALLFTALMRAIKIPTRLMAGVLINSELKAQNHWWNSFYLENIGWIPVDLSLADGLEYKYFRPVEDKRAFYFGNLDSQHIAFSTGWTIIKPSMNNNKIVYRPRSYALQNIWEEASVETDSYSSFWNNPVVLGLY